MSTFYEICMLNIPARYGLSEDGQRMLMAFEDFKTSIIDKADLARIIRFSHSNRAAIVDTMQKCLQIMAKNKKEVKHSRVIMESCTEMLSIADESVTNLGFPFMKLPLETRDRIYKFAMLERTYATNARDALAGPFHPASKRSTCICPFHSQDFKWQKSYTVPMPLARVSKAVSQEFLRSFFSSNPIEFPCACEMHYHLLNNEVLRAAAPQIMFNWCGERADLGISMLKQCPLLEKLTINISAATTYNLTPTEKEIEEWFGRRKHLLVSEGLGFNELIKLRGFKDVQVQHAAKRISDRRTDHEACALNRLLRDRLLKGAEEDDDA